MSWNKVKLAELYTVHNGLSKGRQFFGSGFPFLSFSTVFNNYFIPSELSDLVQSTEKEQRDYSICRGDVFVTRTSETSDELGMSCVALKDYPCATYNGFTKRMRPIEPNRVLPEYIGYYMRMPSFRGEFQAFSTMTTRASLRNEDLLGLEVVLPPIAIQQKIADILSTYDDLIENNKKQIKLLEEAAQRLYKEWFVNLRFPGYENTPIIDGVPQGWRKSVFSDVFSFVRGKSYTSKELSDDSGVLMVNLKNIRAYGGYKRNAEKRFTGAYKEEQLLVGGDVVMGVTDMTQERRLVGHVALIPSFNEKVTFSMDLIKLIPSSVSKNYLYCALQYGGDSEQIAPLANGVNVLHLKPEAMMKMEMLVPDNDTMQAFDVKFEAVRLKIEALEKQCDLAAQARDRLLTKLMSGELEV